MTKYILILGCTSGSIGYFLAQKFVSKGFHVFATARKILNMGDLTSNPDHITTLALDITSPESILAVYDTGKPKSNGKVDMIFRNSGYRSLAMATEASYTESFRMLTTNFVGVIELNRVFADLFVQAKGTIVFTSSLSGLMPQPTNSVYCATEAALDLYVRIFRVELRPFDVNVILVHTGDVQIGMSRLTLDLKEDSRYRYLAPKINKMWHNLETGYMDPNEFAKQTVGKTTSNGFFGPTTNIWAGKSAFLVRVLEWCNLNWAYDSVFARMFGFNQRAPSL